MHLLGSNFILILGPTGVAGIAEMINAKDRPLLAKYDRT